MPLLGPTTVPPGVPPLHIPVDQPTALDLAKAELYKKSVIAMFSKYRCLQAVVTRNVFRSL